MLYLMILRFCGQFLLAKLIDFIFAYIVILIYLPLFPTHINSRVDTFFVAAGCRCRMPYAGCWPVPDAGDCSRPACDYQIKKCLQICSGQFPSKISLGGIPDSCNVLFSQIFLKRAAKPSARNTSAGFPWVKWPQILLNLPWLCTKASQTFSDFFSGTLLNLLRNPVERDLALHQSLPDLR